MSLENLKAEAARRAVVSIKDGMRVGLGTGSTAKHAILEIARKVRNGELKGIVGVATSNESEELARANGLEVVGLDSRPLDIAIDGADEIAPNLDLVKGLGGALLREKLVEMQAREFIVVADHTKMVERLGQKAPLPVEVVRFGSESTIERLRQFGTPVLRQKADETFITDNGNYIVDLRFETDDVAGLAARLKSMTGVVETGFFLGMATRAFVAFEGEVREFKRS
ncbi:MAG TPA: ribose 5-phosphate isomerase A [Pyrinomonadaceae bacterium]|nr:ribose 5-phosphate isomerase A [Pyrinomonadaceae bacterium]